MELDDKVCYCFHVSKRKIINFIRLYIPKRASQISECGGAGTGCGWCIPFLKRYFEQVASGDGTCVDSLTPEDYAKQRAGYIREGRGTPPPGAIPLPTPSDADQGDSSGDDHD